MTNLEAAITLQMQRDYYKAHADKLAEALRKLLVAARGVELESLPTELWNDLTNTELAADEALAAYEAAQ